VTANTSQSEQAGAPGQAGDQAENQAGDQAEPADANDRAALDQYARTLGRDIVADYVAATATLDGPLVSGDTLDRTEP